MKVATFDLINTGEWVDPYAYGEIPAKDPYSMSFERTGFESTLLITNISVILWIYILHGIVFVFFYIPVWLINKKFGKLAGRRQKLEGYFFWGGPLRTLMETFLELLLASLLNTHMADWGTDSPQEKFSNFASLSILCTLALLTLLLVLFFLVNYNMYRFEWSRESYGALIEGTRHSDRTTRRHAMAWPAIFFLRRAVFIFSIIYWVDFLWGQIALQLLSTILMTVYLLEFRPLSTPFANRMELMNEVTTLFLTYGLMCFTKFLPDPEMRNKGGFLYIGILAGNILIHLVLMVRESSY